MHQGSLPCGRAGSSPSKGGGAAIRLRQGPFFETHVGRRYRWDPYFSEKGGSDVGYRKPQAGFGVTTCHPPTGEDSPQNLSGVPASGEEIAGPAGSIVLGNSGMREGGRGLRAPHRWPRHGIAAAPGLLSLLRILRPSHPCNSDAGFAHPKALSLACSDSAYTPGTTTTRPTC